MFPKILKLSIIALMFFGIYHYSDASFKISRPSTLNSGLVGHWTFDGADVTDKVYDKSGQGNHGYFIGGATTTAKVKGKIGQALKFDGVDDYVDVMNSSSLDITSDKLTLSAWIKPNTISQSTNPEIVAKNSDATGYRMRFVNGGTIRFNAYGT